MDGMRVNPLYLIDPANVVDADQNNDDERLRRRNDQPELLSRRVTVGATELDILRL